METIRDRIQAWQRTHVMGATVMTKNTEAFNHMQEAIRILLDEPWANLVIGADMQYESPATTQLKQATASDSPKG